MDTNLGLEKDYRIRLIQELQHFLADTYAVYLKVQGFHWNMQGDFFRALHPWMEEVYRDLAEDVDTIAERIMQIGGHAPASFEEYQNLTQISEQHDFSDMMAMVQLIVTDLSTVIRSARNIGRHSSEAADNATTSLMDSYIQDKEKLVWMLGKFLA